MNDSGPLGRIVEEVEYLLARRRYLAQERPRLEVVHGYHQPGTICLPGETIEQCLLRFQDREVPIHLSEPATMVCDCIARHHHSPLSIARMERILVNDPFYRRLGAHGFERIDEMPTFTRASLRVYIARLREQIAKALRKGGSMLPPEEALVSEPTDSNQILHRIALPVAVVHRTMKLM